MWPTLRVPDVLLVEPYPERSITVGDVIVYRHPADDRLIVHRVIGVVFEGVRTKGDYNRQIDSYVVEFHRVMGRVSWAERNGRMRRILGGSPGRIIAFMAGVQRRLLTAFLAIPRSIYRSLAQSKWITRQMSVWVRPRVIGFSRPEGIELQLFLGSLPIGVLRPGQTIWTIRPPFRLLVCEASLPSPPRFLNEFR